MEEAVSEMGNESLWHVGEAGMEHRSGTPGRVEGADGIQMVSLNQTTPRGKAASAKWQGNTIKDLGGVEANATKQHQEYKVLRLGDFAERKQHGRAKGKRDRRMTLRSPDSMDKEVVRQWKLGRRRESWFGR